MTYLDPNSTLQRTSLYCSRCGQRNSRLNARCIACDNLLTFTVEPGEDATSSTTDLNGQSSPSPISTTAPTSRLADTSSGTPPKADTAAALPSPEDTPSGVRRMSHYMLFNLVGAGGMGEVYRAYDDRLDRLVALKVIRTDTGVDEASKRRFLDEARLVGQLDHPNIVPVYELDEAEDGTLFFAMKLVEGETLNQVWADQGDDRLAPHRLSKSLQILVKVCDALAFAHNRGVVHRDLKPSNIMVGEYGAVYLMDWGAAFLRRLPGDEEAPLRRFEAMRVKSGDGTVVGTLSYMAPEQARGVRSELDARTDIFALGAILYHLLTGRPPYVGGEDIGKLLRRIQVANFPAPEEIVKGGQVPPALSEIVRRATAAKPEERYVSVLELQQDLDGFMHGFSQRPVRTRFPAGTRILSAGQPGDAAYLLHEGRCAERVGHGEALKTLRELEPGDTFGAAAVFAEARQDVDVEALEDVVVSVITPETLRNEVGMGSWTGSFVRFLAQRYLDAGEKMREMEHDREALRKLLG